MFGVLGFFLGTLIENRFFEDAVPVVNSPISSYRPKYETEVSLHMNANIIARLTEHTQTTPQETLENLLAHINTTKGVFSVSYTL